MFRICRVILGRTHVKTVAETRKAELEGFLQELIKLAAEISEVKMNFSLPNSITHVQS